MLGPSGPVDKVDFKAILSGKWPDKGIELGRRVESAETGRARLEHRPGDDLTFKAPKSVSIAALKHGEVEAADAHDEAVRRVLRRLESRNIATRRNQRRVNTGNMVAAMFTHDASRNHDPHFHTHVILANMTRRDDGRWMSIDRGGVSLEMRLSHRGIPARASAASRMTAFRDAKSLCGRWLCHGAGNRNGTRVCPMRTSEWALTDPHGD